MRNSVKISTLFRGDSLPKTIFDQHDPKHRGKTWANYYKTEGLMAKFNDGGASWMDKKSLSWLVAAHVGYIKAPDGEQPTKEQFSSYHRAKKIKANRC